MDDRKNNRPVEVFDGNSWQAGMVKSLLENAEISAYLTDEFVGTLSPWWSAPGGVGAVKVMVAGRDLTDAQSIVDEYEQNLRNSEF